MRRNLLGLTEREYDLVIVGGGIYGISIARDAILRGLAVALVDQSDFGNATSSNLHKIIHGGFRYLQHADLKRMRESIRERSILMRTAPHLVYPLPFLIPIYSHVRPGMLVTATALKLNDLISFDRNRDLDPQRIIPRGRMISKAHCLRLCPLLDQTGLTGGALFYDAQVHNPDRLNLSLLLSAMKAGADAANYAQVTGFLRDGSIIKGIKVKDVLSGKLFEVRTRIVVNCTGPWTDRVLQLLGIHWPKNIRWCKAIVLVTRLLTQDIAVGLLSRFRYEDRDALFSKGYRFFFVTPWRNRSLIGTFQVPYDGDPDHFEITEQDLHEFIQEIDAAFPNAGIKRQDVHFVYRGLLPMTNGQGKAGDVQLVNQYEIKDHAVEQGIEGLVSVLGVKYSTARDVAEKTVDLVVKKLSRNPIKCQTAVTPVYGGAIDYFQEFITRRLEERPAKASPEILGHLLRTYGSEYQEILEYCQEDAGLVGPVTNGSPVIKAEVLHGIRQEMAQKLTDIVFRRTELGTAGYPGDSCLKTCAEIMAAELRWDQAKTQQEIEEVKGIFLRRGLSAANVSRSLDSCAEL